MVLEIPYVVHMKALSRNFYSTPNLGNRKNYIINRFALFSIIIHISVVSPQFLASMISINPFKSGNPQKGN